MKPYYEHGGIVIYHGDCREVLPSLGAVDLVLTDPPYNLGRAYTGGFDDAKGEAEWQAWIDSVVPLLLRAANTVLLTPGIANLAHYLKHEPRWVLAWHKPFSMSHSPVGFNNWEPILFWGKWRKKRYSDYICAPLVKRGEVAGHDCPKPLALFAALVEWNSTSGELVLDPFMGSGTTLRAAKDLGRKAIGIEIEERYCEIAAKRLAQECFNFAI